MRNVRPASGPQSPPQGSDAARGRLKLLLRVYSAEELAHSSSAGAYCKLYLGESAMLDGGASGGARKSLSREDSPPALATSPPPPGEDLLQLTHRDSAGRDDGEVDGVRVFRTKVAHQQPNKLAPPETIWNERFEVPMPARSGADAPAILSVRVKSQHLLYCPVIGACAISLISLRVGERLEQWFPLHKGKKPAGRIRLTLLLALDDGKPRPGSGHRLADNNNNNNNSKVADVLAARAANLEADEAIKRLLERRLREDAERRQRKLTRRASRQDGRQRRSEGDGGPLAEVGPPVFEMSTNRWEDASALVARKLDDVVPRGAAKRAPRSQPAPLPPLGVAADREPDARGSLEATSASLAEQERRLDRKLRRLQRERRRLQALRQQLKKFVPDLNAESDSGSDSTDSDASEGHRDGDAKAEAAAVAAAARDRRSSP